MKFRWSLYFFVLCLLVLWLVTAPRKTVPVAATTQPVPTATLSPAATAVKGVWVASVDNLNFPTQTGQTPEQLTQQIDAMVTNCADAGITDIFLQVRPSGDALYPSAIFPWSATLTGTEGQAPPDNFDPLQAWIDASHAKGLRLHAWLNPFRLSKPGKASLFAQQHLDWTVAYKGAVYLDPGNADARAAIEQGVRELCDNYDIDGIHFDDYFYPSPDFNDSVSYAATGNGKPLADWRINNVNTLIAHCRDIAHEYNKRFGISPSGIWANAKTNAKGSDTNGSESLTGQYADSVSWVEQGLIDYIVPQIYWERGHEAADFTTLLQWWQSVCADSSVELYIGLAAYKQVDPKSGDAWQAQTPDELTAQLAAIEPSSADGVVFFDYNSFVQWQQKKS